MKLLLTFQIGEEHYASRVETIIEIVPLVKLKPMPLAEPWVAGVFDYRGVATPAIDLCQIFEQREARHSMSTRILVVSYPTGAGTCKPLGLIAERVIETVRLSPEAFQDAGVDIPSAPFLGGVYHHSRGLLQLVDVTRLLPPQVADRLFREDPDTTLPQAGVPDRPAMTHAE